MMYFSYLANVLTPLARLLKQYANLETVLVCYGRDMLPKPTLYDFDEGAFAEIVEMDPILAADETVDEKQSGALADAAAHIERRYNLNVIELIRSDRHVGIGWVTSVSFPQSEYGRQTSYPQSVDVVIRLVRAFEDLIDRRPPLAIVGSSSAVGPSVLWHMLKGLGVETRTMAIARSGEALFWSRDEYMLPEGFAKAYQDALRSEVAPQLKETDSSWLAPSVRAQAVLESLSQSVSWRELARQLYLSIRTLAGNRLYRSSHAYGKYLPLQQIKLIIERHFWRRRIVREKPVMTAVPDDAAFVFFPLQIEPEATLMMESPMCDSHLTAIDWLAKTAPGGWYVVVKEHPGATAPRTQAFWQTIETYPNVIVARTLEDARGIAERARAVAVLNGSLGVQAATIGKPVITFHPEFIARCMPHVLFADSYQATKDALATIRDNKLPPMAERAKTVSAFLHAQEVSAFPVSDPQILSGKSMPEKAVAADINKIARTLLETLDLDVSASASHQEAVGAEK